MSRAKTAARALRLIVRQLTPRHRRRIRPMPARVAQAWRWTLGAGWSTDERRGPTVWNHRWVWRPWCWLASGHEPWFGAGLVYCLTCGADMPAETAAARPRVEDRTRSAGRGATPTGREGPTP